MVMSRRLLKPASEWTPLRLSPMLWSSVGFGGLRALTAGGAAAGDGDAVQTMVANTGQTFTAASAGVRPVWRANSGQPYLDFDSGKWLLSTENSGLSGNFAAECYYLAKVTGDNSASRFLGGFGLSTANNSIRHASLDAGRGWSMAFGGTGNNWETSIVHTSDWVVIGFIKAPGAASTTSRIRLNGVDRVGTSSTNPTPNVTNAPYFLAASAHTGQAPGEVHIRDVVYTPPLTVAQRLLLESWLTKRGAGLL